MPCIYTASHRTVPLGLRITAAIPANLLADSGDSSVHPFEGEWILNQFEALQARVPVVMHGDAERLGDIQIEKEPGA